MKGIEIYNSLSRPPREALREIQAGKLKGKTDINPQWRYKAMTEVFDLAGLGWKYEIQKLWTEQGAGVEKLAFAQVAVFIKDGDSWSEPVVGIGGSKLVQIEKGGPVSNDEGYKMAVTDAFSTALKMLGVAADIYAGMWDGVKYKDEAPQPAPQQPTRAPRGKYQRQATGPQFAPAPAQQQQAPQQPAQQQPQKWSEIQQQALVEVLTTKHADGSDVFDANEKTAYNKMFKMGLPFEETIKQARDTLAVRLQNRQAQQQQAPQQPAPGPAPQPAPQPAPAPNDNADIF